MKDPNGYLVDGSKLIVVIGGNPDSAESVLKEAAASLTLPPESVSSSVPQKTFDKVLVYEAPKQPSYDSVPASAKAERPDPNALGDAALKAKRFYRIATPPTPAAGGPAKETADYSKLMGG